MSVEQLLSACREAGISIRLTKGVVKVRGRQESVEQMMPALLKRKAEVQAHLSLIDCSSAEPGSEQFLRQGGAHNHSSGALRRQLEPFCLDRIDEGADDIEEVTRVNNIAFYLVSVKGWPFELAMEAAAKWVTNHPPHADEAGFQDALSIWKKLASTVR